MIWMQLHRLYRRLLLFPGRDAGMYPLVLQHFLKPTSDV